MRIRKRLVILILWFGSVATGAKAQPVAADAAQASGSKPTWSLRAYANAYLLPDDDNYVQPTVIADRGSLHLEGRYNYEDLDSVSGFVGRNIESGKTVTFQLTPMFGVVGGNTNGIIPALEMGIVWKRLELYSEAEYVIDVKRRSNNFFYSWSEASVWVTTRIRAGLTTQRTRTHGMPLDAEGGALIGVAVSKLEGTVYLFNPASNERFIVMSMSVTF